MGPRIKRAHRGAGRAAMVLAVVTVAASLAAPSGADTVPVGASGEAVPGAEALTQSVQLPVRLTVDPVAGTVEAGKLPGRLLTIDGAGETVASSPLDFDLSDSPTTAAATSGTASGPAPVPCTPSDTPVGFKVLRPFHVTLAGNPDLYLQYGFYPFQQDDARVVGVDQQRQFIACVDGGGSTFNNMKQTVNGAGSTVEDVAPKMIGKGSWGTKRDSQNIVAAELGFEVPIPKVPVKITGKLVANVSDAFKGGQGADDKAPSLATYAANQVNGFWETSGGFFDTGTSDYTGNVHLAGPWEYPMTDTTSKTIRGEAYMKYSCVSGPFGLGECAGGSVRKVNSYNPSIRGNTVSAGGGHSLAVKNDGTVWAWGENFRGELGDGTTTDSNRPVQVSGLTNVATVAAGWGHSLALKNDGSVWAWGHNYYGQLGDGTTTGQLSEATTGRPQAGPVVGIGDVAAVAAGSTHSLALRNDGTVWAWGSNYYGQLGDGTTVDRARPVQVSGLTGVVSVDASFSNSFALKSDGTLWAWGANYSGQLGDGTKILRVSPVQVSGMVGVVAVSAGSFHTLALKGDGTAWAWGSKGPRQDSTRVVSCWCEGHTGGARAILRGGVAAYERGAAACGRGCRV